MMRILFVAALLIGVVLIALVMGEQTRPTASLVTSDRLRYSVSGLMAERPLGESVTVTGQVVQVQKDHVSQAGNVYQRFVIADMTRDASVLVFCSTLDGRVTVEEEDMVQVTGTFKKYHDLYEVYAACVDVMQVS